MRIDVFTIFPEYLEQPLAVSLVGRAREAGLLDVRLHDPREHATARTAPSTTRRSAAVPGW
jgi:tRNA (guanine37-N1)-methyltransferase